MKKIIFLVALAIITVSGANAQKFQGGEKNLEVQFTPLGGSPIGINGIRLRMFNSESSAIRIGLNIVSSNVQTVNTQQTKTMSSDNKVIILPELYDTDKTFDFGLRAGYEKHFTGTDRLSPYVGGEIAIAMGSETLIREFHNANNADDQPKPENWQTWEMSRKQGTFTWGLNVVAGVDFYFVDNFYLGAEIGLGVQSKKYKDRETEAGNADAWKYSQAAQADEDFDQAVWNDEETAVEYRTIIGDGDGNFKEMGFGTNFQSTLRLGWLF